MFSSPPSKHAAPGRPQPGVHGDHFGSPCEAQDRSRSPTTGHGRASGMCGSHGSPSQHSNLAGHDPQHGVPLGWTTGDRDLDDWLHTQCLENYVFHRLCMVYNMADRHQIVQACRGNVTRIRCMAAFLNGCISKSLREQHQRKCADELRARPRVSEAQSPLGSHGGRRI